MTLNDLERQDARAQRFQRISHSRTVWPTTINFGMLTHVGGRVITGSATLLSKQPHFWTARNAWLQLELDLERPYSTHQQRTGMFLRWSIPAQRNGAGHQHAIHTLRGMTQSNQILQVYQIKWEVTFTGSTTTRP